MARGSKGGKESWYFNRVEETVWNKWELSINKF